MERGDLPAVVGIVKGLSDWFTDDVPDKVESDLGDGRGWVLLDGTTIVGFAVVAPRSPRSAEILWMGVDVRQRGQGAGTVLLQSVFDDLAAGGVVVVEVKTLDASEPYPPYVGTRAFWERRGFVYVDTIRDYADWQTRDPAAVYVAALAPTR